MCLIIIIIYVGRRSSTMYSYFAKSMSDPMKNTNGIAICLKRVNCAKTAEPMETPLREHLLYTVHGQRKELAICVGCQMKNRLSLNYTGSS